MYYSFPEEIDEEDIINEINYYLEGKSIGRFIFVHVNCAYMRITRKYIKQSGFKDIIDELVYLTKRFKLIPLDKDSLPELFFVE